MSYKSILIHLNDERRARNIAAHGVELAKTFGAHLIGLHVFPAYRLQPPVALPVGGEVVAGIRKRIEDETGRIKAAFEVAVASQPFTSEWRSVTTERTDPAVVVMAHGRGADLILASQSDRAWELSTLLDFPERLAIESGRPLLVLPNGSTVSRMPKKILLAWNGSRESARAMFDAMPFLERAEAVHVTTVEEGEREALLPADALKAALERHGVKATVERIKPVKSAGEDLRERANAHGADLLVMGAYGHARLREFVFGGVTRHTLQTMTIPVLFSH